MDLVWILVHENIGPSAYRGVMRVTYRVALADGVAGKRRGKWLVLPSSFSANENITSNTRRAWFRRDITVVCM